MPFASTSRPSIQLGLLKAVAEQSGFPTATLHLGLDFAADIGTAFYEAIADGRNPQFGDWIFAAEAFGDADPDPDDTLIGQFPGHARALHEDGAERLRRARRRQAPAFLDRMMAEIPWGRFAAIGFTCTFQQNVASFALARRLKAAYPATPLIFGGANFDGEMGAEFLEKLDFIDYAVIGEGDIALPALLRALRQGSDPTQVAGVIGRRNGALAGTRASALPSLEGLPVPDYAEYFERRDRLGLVGVGHGAKLRLPFEGSRGCWWGQKHHCTFCGLNGGAMRFRSKPAEAILHELSTLAQRHGVFAFEAVDNILDTGMFQTFFERLQAAGIDYDIFYEIKSNLTRGQIRQLAQGGVRRVQPGIESLSTSILRLMRKGVSAIQNVNTLRWLTYYRILTSWNLLWGFPGETLQDYEDQRLLLRHLAHLPPPLSAGRVWMERFSPLYFDRDRFPVRSLRPESSYALIYPEALALDRIAYFFDYELVDTLPDAAFDATRDWVSAWQAAWLRERPRLVFWHAPGVVRIEDSRARGTPRIVVLRDRPASLYAACSDQPRTATQLAMTLASPDAAAAITRELDDLVRDGLMMREGVQYLSLALPASQGR